MLTHQFTLNQYCNLPLGVNVQSSDRVLSMQYMIEPYKFGSLMVLVSGVYLQYREHRRNSVLDLADHYLLIYNHVLMVSVLLGGWVMQTLYYSVLGTHTYISLIICSYSRYNPSPQNLFNAQLLNVCLLSYLLLKIYTQKSQFFGVGELIGDQVYKGVSESLQGWNCTFVEYSVLSVFWLSEEVYSLWTGYWIIKAQHEVDHLWKGYFIKRKILPSIFCMAVMLVHNAGSFCIAKSPASCMAFWVGTSFWEQVLAQVMKVLIYVGPCCATVIFYYTTLPMFNRSTPAETQEPLMLA